jgi:hypothetical protein
MNNKKYHIRDLDNFYSFLKDPIESYHVLYQHPEMKRIYSNIYGTLFREWNGISMIEAKIAWNKYYGFTYGKKGKMWNRTVWECIYGLIIPENFIIDHVDGNPENNHIENLECVSRSENSRRAKNYLNKSYPDRIIHEYACSTILK